MTAGRGVVHAEMPGGHGVQRGINLWINLSSKDKMYSSSSCASLISRSNGGYYVTVADHSLCRAVPWP